jgi:FtsH-binding integral membrane protein
MRERRLNIVEKSEFDKVWGVVLEIGAQERHFNNLQTVYRTMASTWLLSSFAAMGYILSKEFQPGIERELLIAAVAAVGTVGIVLLWVLDARVYQQLLGSCFVEGYLLENLYPWLPPVRHNMWKSQNNLGVLSRVVDFYAAPTVLLAAIASCAASILFWRVGNALGSTLCFVIGISLAGWIGHEMRRISRTSEDTEKRIEHSDAAAQAAAAMEAQALAAAGGDGSIS